MWSGVHFEFKDLKEDSSSWSERARSTIGDKAEKVRQGQMRKTSPQEHPSHPLWLFLYPKLSSEGLFITEIPQHFPYIHYFHLEFPPYLHHLWFYSIFKILFKFHFLHESFRVAPNRINLTLSVCMNFAFLLEFVIFQVTYFFFLTVYFSFSKLYTPTGQESSLIHSIWSLA